MVTLWPSPACAEASWTATIGGPPRREASDEMTCRIFMPEHGGGGDSTFGARIDGETPARRAEFGCRARRPGEVRATEPIIGHARTRLHQHLPRLDRADHGRGGVHRFAPGGAAAGAGRDGASGGRPFVGARSECARRGIARPGV